MERMGRHRVSAQAAVVNRSVLHETNMWNKAQWSTGSVAKHPVNRGLGLELWWAEIESWAVTKSLLQPIKITLCNASQNFTLTRMLRYRFPNNPKTELFNFGHTFGMLKHLYSFQHCSF